MHTIKLEIDDNLYDAIVKSGVNIQYEIKSTLHKIIHKKEHQIASDIKQALDEVKLFEDGKIELQDADDMLKELRSAC